MKAVFVLLLLLAPLVSTTRSQATDRSQQSGTPSDSEDKTICVLGNVSKPSRLRFRTGITVTKAIEEAGGILPNSKSKKVRVYSQTTEGVIRVLDVDLDIVRKKPYMDLELQSFDIVEVVFSKKDCKDYIKKLIAAVDKNDKYSDDALKLFDRVNGEGGFQLKNITSKYAGQADINGGNRVVYLRPKSPYGNSRLDEHSTNGYAVAVLNELMHHARKDGVYEDRSLGKAAFKLLTPAEQSKYPLPDPHNVDKNSSYFHSLFNLHCHSLTGE